MADVDHEVRVYPDSMQCSCGDIKTTLDHSLALRKAYQHARKYIGNSRVLDTTIEYKE